MSEFVISGQHTCANCGHRWAICEGECCPKCEQTIEVVVEQTVPMSGQKFLEKELAEAQRRLKLQYEDHVRILGYSCAPMQATRFIGELVDSLRALVANMENKLAINSNALNELVDKKIYLQESLKRKQEELDQVKKERDALAAKEYHGIMRIRSELEFSTTALNKIGALQAVKNAKTMPWLTIKGAIEQYEAETRSIPIEEPKDSKES